MHGIEEGLLDKETKPVAYSTYINTNDLWA